MTRICPRICPLVPRSERPFRRSRADDIGRFSSLAGDTVPRNERICYLIFAFPRSAFHPNCGNVWVPPEAPRRVLHFGQLSFVFAVLGFLAIGPAAETESQILAPQLLEGPRVPFQALVVPRIVIMWVGHCGFHASDERRHGRLSFFGEIGHPWVRWVGGERGTFV